MSNFQPLPNLLSSIVDNRGKSAPITNSGIKLIATNCIKDDRLYPTYDNIRYISEETYNTFFRSHIMPNDILFVNKGTPGKVALVPSNLDFEIVQDTIGLRADASKIYWKYLFYQLRSNRIKNIISNNNVGLIIPHFKKSFLDRIMIDVKPMDEQKKIGDLLFLLETKIEKNNKINAELESMAKTLYDYWFLQFEFPNEEGKPYKSIGGKMVYNEELKREIPEGWEIKNLMSNPLCKDIKAGVDYFESKNYLPTANIDGEQITDGDNVTYENRENRANMQPSKNSVWFAKMKNSIKHLSIPNNSEWFINKYILSTGFQGLQCTEESFAYIHCFINQKWFEIYKDVLSHGATQEGVNNEDLKSVLMVIPPRDILIKFSKMITSSLEDKFSKIKENQELSSLRDFLLPLLMNGQVTIK